MKKILMILFAVVVAATATMAKCEYNESDMVRIQKAVTLMDKGDCDEAIAILDTLIQVYPGNVSLVYEKAFAYYLKNDFKETEKLLKPIYKKKSADSDMDMKLIYALLGSSYFNQGDIKKANKVYEQAIELWPNEGMLYHNLGVNYLKQNDDKKALATFERGIRNAPEWKSNYRGALSLLNNNGSIAKNICYMTTLALLDPESEDSEKLISAIPEIINNMVKRKEDGGYDITINANSENTMADMMMALHAAASTTLKDNPGNKLDQIVNNLKSAVNINVYKDIPLVEFLKAMETEDETMPSTFWYVLMGQNYPMEFQDWSTEHSIDISKLSQWLSANPFPLPKK